MGNCEGGKKETKRKIVQAFWGLYKTTSIEKITVKNITDVCGIYRTTFYLHFADVYAILEMIESELMKELKAVEACRDIPADAEMPRESMNQVYAMLKKNYDYLSILLDEQRNPQFSRIYKTELAHQICVICHVDLSRFDEREAAVFRKTFSVIIDMMFSWAESALFTFDEVAHIVDGYLRDGIFITLGISLENSERKGELHSA